MEGAAGGPGGRVSAANQTAVWYESHRLSSLTFKGNERCRGLQWAGFIISTPASAPNSCPRLNVSLTPTTPPTPPQSSRRSSQREQRQRGRRTIACPIRIKEWCPCLSRYWPKYLADSDWNDLISQPYSSRKTNSLQFQTKRCLFSQKPRGKSSISLPQLQSMRTKLEESPRVTGRTELRRLHSR